jgi:hypothetical protein
MAGHHHWKINEDLEETFSPSQQAWQASAAEISSSQQIGAVDSAWFTNFLSCISFPVMNRASPSYPNIPTARTPPPHSPGPI